MLHFTQTKKRQKKCVNQYVNVCVCVWCVFQDGDCEQECVVKVDDCGFFIYWKSETRVSECQECGDDDNGTMFSSSLRRRQEGDVLELCQVNDIRAGKLPQVCCLLACLVSSELGF